MKPMTDELAVRAWADDLSARVNHLTMLVQQGVRNNAPTEHRHAIEEAKWRVVSMILNTPTASPATSATRAADLILTPQTLAERWGISQQRVRDLAKSGQLRHFKVGSLLRFKLEFVQEYEQRMKTEGRDGG